MLSASPIRFTSIGKRMPIMLTVQTDLNAPRLPFLRQKLRIRKARSDHEQGVAFLHQSIAGFGAQQTNAPGDERQIVRITERPSSAFATPAPSSSAVAITSSTAWRAPAPPLPRSPPVSPGSAHLPHAGARPPVE